MVNHNRPSKMVTNRTSRSSDKGALRWWLAGAIILIALATGATGYALSTSKNQGSSSLPTQNASASAPAGPTVATPTTTPASTASQPPDRVAPPGGSSFGISGFNAIGCMSATSCVEVGSDSAGAGVAATSTGNTTTFTKDALPEGTPSLNAVSCASAGTCVADGDGSVVSSTNGGTSWALHTLPLPGLTLVGALCQSATQCLVTGYQTLGDLAGNQAEIFHSTDGGSTWAPSTMPAAVGGISAIACPTTTRCIGVGSAVVVSNDGGVTWAYVPVNGGSPQLASIACASSTQCIAVGPNPAGISNPAAPGLAVETTDGGSSFGVITLPAKTASVFDVSCASSTSCEAGGAMGTGATSPTFVASSDGGTTWRNQAAPPGFSAVSGLSCPSAAGCVAVGRTTTGPTVAQATTSGQWTESQPTSTSNVFASSAS
jgi:hypothetical protein